MTRFRRILTISLGAASLLGVGALLLVAKTGRGFRWALDELYHREFPDVTTVDPEHLARELAGDRPPLLLDTRAPEEFAVSHLASAQLVGAAGPDADELEEIDRHRPIVVYCSIGYRSGRVARRLKDAGFANVRNLHGGIFRWYNEGRPVFANMREVERIHPYDLLWGQFITRPGKTSDIAATDAE